MVLLGEMPLTSYAARLAVSGATNRATNFAVTVTFLPLLNAAGLARHASYAMGAVPPLPFVWTVRETKGKTLEQRGHDERESFSH